MLKYKQVNNIYQKVEAERTKHSKKPQEVRNRIELLFGDLPRIELFARQTSPGWDVWGNEV
jgi:N6-adenosine-specific RNA methylase IME4